MKFETAGIHFLGDVYSAVAVVVDFLGRDPFNQNFRKFRSKSQWIGSVQPEKFRKNGSPFEVILFSRSDRSAFWLNGSGPCKIPQMRRQRELQKSNWWQTTTLHVHHALLYISLPHCATTTGKCLISRFIEDVNNRRLDFLCLSELGCGS